MITIQDRKIGKNFPTFIVAELSGNHNGKLENAIKLIREAKNAGADAVKLQTYTPDTITLNCNSEHFQIKGTHLWDNRTLYNLYQQTYTPWEWTPTLQKTASDLGLILFSSPFDTTAVDYLEKLNVPCYKIASAELTDHILIKKIAQTKKPVIMSSGMASLGELEEVVNLLRDNGTSEIAMLKCTAEYPAKIEDANLITINNMINTFNVVGGLSDHSNGIIVPIMSIAFGASIIEKHLTLSKTSGSADDAFSLESSEFMEMCSSIRIAEKTIGTIKYGGVKGEQEMKHFRRSLFFVKDMIKGDIIDNTCIRSIRPGFGLHTKYYDDIINKHVTQDIKFGTPTDWKLFN
jgi:pseudaminic acid synthase